MLWALVVLLLVFWLLGFTVFSLGSLIHVVLVVVILMAVYAFVTGRRVGP